MKILLCGLMLAAAALLALPTPSQAQMLFSSDLMCMEGKYDAKRDVCVVRTKKAKPRKKKKMRG